MSRSRSPPPPPRRGQNDRNRDFGRSDRDRERNGGGRRREDDRDKMDVDSPPRRYRDDDGPSRGGRPELKIKGRANALLQDKTRDQLARRESELKEKALRNKVIRTRKTSVPA